jgi:hypothetical protein
MYTSFRLFCHDALADVHNGVMARNIEGRDSKGRSLLSYRYGKDGPAWDGFLGCGPPDPLIGQPLISLCAHTGGAGVWYANYPNYKVNE